MTQYNVTGMSCAACVARVEKAVSKIDGVNSCSVSLLTNSMNVDGSADSSAIIKAVQNAGYGASLKGKHECHLEPDWLLIYEYLDDELILFLTRTGSHSDLF